MLPATLSNRFSQLSIGVSRTSVRHGHFMPKRQRPQYKLAKFPEGHGEQIWVWSHQLTRQVVYSHSKIMESHRVLRQLPFNGKKLRPAALRKDYWKPMAMIQLPKGAGAAGQSVFQKLREFRKMHELCWDESLRFDVVKTEALSSPEKGPRPVKERRRVLNKFERGQRLNDQVKGRLQGRKWLDYRMKLANQLEALKELNREQKLLPVTVSWAVDADRNYASSWSENVKHKLFDDAVRLLEVYKRKVPKASKKPNDKEPKDKKPDDKKPTGKDNIKYVYQEVKDDIPAEFSKKGKAKAVGEDRTIRDE
uniref:Large ribosomal subunit protein mL67 n=1 Tax=Colletotrichum fructicola (strain Nara gc5) TaxID=1213859 RepID=L2GAI1_COLFN